MLPTRTIYAFALLFLLTGCADTTEPPDSSLTTDESHDADGSHDSHDADSLEHDAEESGDKEDAADNSQAAMEAPAEPEKPTHNYLELPDGLSPQIVQAYSQIATGAQAGEVMGLLNLVGISQEIANQVNDTDVATADGFYKQAAVALRAGREMYQEELPGAFVGPVFFNEARAFARSGDIETAAKSLEEAILGGFSDMDALREAEDLEPVRAADGFAEQLVKWEAAAIAKLAAQAKEELAAGKTFPFEFTLKDLDGKEHSLADYKGKVVIVDIWGTWCPPCREEIPSFIKLQNELGDQGFQMIGLNYEREDNPEADLKVATDYVKENGINYPCFLGDEATRDQVTDFQGFPTTLFIDKSGKVRMMAVGLHEYGFLKGIVSELLAEESSEAAAAE